MLPATVLCVLLIVGGVYGLHLLSLYSIFIEPALHEKLTSCCFWSIVLGFNGLFFLIAFSLFT